MKESRALVFAEVAQREGNVIVAVYSNNEYFTVHNLNDECINIKNLREL